MQNRTVGLVTHLALLALSPLAAVTVAACDNSGARPNEASGFPQEDSIARQIEGRVLSGVEIVPGAMVLLQPTRPGFATDERLDPSSPAYLTSTDPGGKYHILDGPFFYDLSIRKDREVVSFRSLAVRYFEPPLAGGAPVHGYTADVAATASPAPLPGYTIAYFVSGADARTVTGEGSSLVATFRRFEAVITLHAVEYPMKDGLVAATRAGRADIRVRSGGATSVVVQTSALDPVDDVNDVRFIALPPAGFALSPVEIVMDLGVRTSARPVARVDAGTPLHVDIVRSARYFARAVASDQGAISDSGLQYINPFEKNIALTLSPPVREATFDGTSVFSAVADTTVCEASLKTDPLTATLEPACVSVIEHVLTPSPAGGTSLRILTASREVTIPDVTRLGLTRPTGLYTWTVQHFPALKRLDNFSGEDVRVMTPFSSTAPRTIDLH